MFKKICTKQNLINFPFKNFKSIINLKNKLLNIIPEEKYEWQPHKYKYKSPFVKPNENINPYLEIDFEKSNIPEDTKEILKEVFKPRKTIHELLTMNVYEQMKVIFINLVL